MDPTCWGLERPRSRLPQASGWSLVIGLKSTRSVALIHGTYVGVLTQAITAVPAAINPKRIWPQCRSDSVRLYGSILCSMFSVPPAGP